MATYDNKGNAYTDELDTLESQKETRWGDMGANFSDKCIRIRFIRKVYLIVSVQLMFTFGICMLFVIPQGTIQGNAKFL